MIKAYDVSFKVEDVRTGALDNESSYNEFFFGKQFIVASNSREAVEKAVIGLAAYFRKKGHKVSVDKHCSRGSILIDGEMRWTKFVGRAAV